MRHPAWIAVAPIALGLAVIAGVHWLGIPPGEVFFAAPMTIADGFEASSVTAVDIDRDGAEDVLAASSVDGQILWWRNPRSAGEAWIATVVAADYPGASWVGISDVDGDGAPDVVGASENGGNVGWWENTAGNGSAWTLHSVDAAFAGATSVRALDLDGDGDADLVGAGSVADQIAWWENLDGVGSQWTRHIVASAFDGASSVDASDLDLDGDLDLAATAADSGEVVWLVNPRIPDPATMKGSLGAEEWVQRPVAGMEAPFHIDVLDLENNGKINILVSDRVAGPGGDTTTLINLELSLDTWLEKSSAQGLPVAAPRFADLDLNGGADAIVGNVVVAFGVDGAEAFRYSIPALDPAALVVHTPSRNDGRWDIFASTPSSSPRLAVLASEFIHRNATFTQPQPISRASVSYQVMTSVLRASYAHYLNLYAIGSPASSDERQRLTGHSYFSDDIHNLNLDDLDFNRDGRNDVLGIGGPAPPASDGLLIWAEQPAALADPWIEHVIDVVPGGRDALAVDVDSDGDVDVVGAAFEADRIAWWENTLGDATDWSIHVVDDSFSGAIAVDVADLDSDGDLDLLGAGFAADEIAWWENRLRQGAGWFGRTIGSAFSGANDVLAADVDRDGDRDVLGVAFASGRIHWWENLDGAGTSWMERTLATGLAGAAEITMADMDRDGDLDVIATAITANQVAWFENTGVYDAAWPAVTVDPVVFGAIAVDVDDADRDGDPDLVVAAFEGDSVIFYENATGDATVFFKYVLDSTFDGATDVQFVDMDHDGRPDVLASATLAAEAAWWPNRGGQFGFAHVDTAPAQLESRVLEDLLRIDLRHLGRFGDNDIELATLALRLEGADGTALTTTQAGTLIEKLSVFLDDGSRDFEAESDTEVIGLTALQLVDGVQTMVFPDGNSLLRMGVGPPNRYFVVVEPTAGAAGADPNTLRVVHLGDGGSRVEDAVHDIPLIPEQTSPFASGASTAIGCAGDVLQLRLRGGTDTLLDWTASSGASGYDVVRGALHQLHGLEMSVGLGDLSCLENDSADATTDAGSESVNPDLEIPGPGQGFFYLVRPIDGTVAAAYGKGAECTLPRVGGNGDCPG